MSKQLDVGIVWVVGMAGQQLRYQIQVINNDVYCSSFTGS